MLIHGARNWHYFLSDATTTMHAIHVSHVGKNYPCLQDPNRPGMVTKFNSSNFWRNKGEAQIQFNQLANWGE